VLLQDLHEVARRRAASDALGGVAALALVEGVGPCVMLQVLQ
jgi:hypothetical protein